MAPVVETRQGQNQDRSEFKIQEQNRYRTEPELEEFYGLRMALERKVSVAVGACVQSFTNHLTPEKDQFGVQNPRISLKKMW